MKSINNAIKIINWFVLIWTNLVRKSAVFQWTLSRTERTKNAVGLRVVAWFTRKTG